MIPFLYRSNGIDRCISLQPTGIPFTGPRTVFVSKKKLPRTRPFASRPFEELGPTFVKLGQVLSIRPDVLPPKTMKELARLQVGVSGKPVGFWQGGNTRKNRDFMNGVLHNFGISGVKWVITTPVTRFVKPFIGVR